MKKLFLVLGCAILFNGVLAQTKSILGTCSEKFPFDFSKFYVEEGGLYKCVVGKDFPDFAVETMSGNRLNKNDLSGKVVLLNFWFIACKPCVAEIPMLEELSKSYDAKDFVVISFTRDDLKSVEDFFKKHKASFETVVDAKKLIENSFEMNFGFPTNFFLNKKGQIIEFKIGGAIDQAGIDKTKEVFKKIIESELKK